MTRYVKASPFGSAAARGNERDWPVAFTWLPGAVNNGAALANVIEDLVPAALHSTGQYENNRVECDHGRLKARLRPMRGLKTHRTASVAIRGHAFIQNLCSGHFELAVDATARVPAGRRIR